MRLRSWIAPTIGVLLSLVPSALSQQTSGEAATDLKVRLFSTLAVRSLRVLPEHATVRLCLGCVSKPMTGQIVVSAGPVKGALMLDGARSRSVFFEGQLKLVADNGKAASGAGRWQVSAAADGLHAVLTLPSERYVMAVLAGEATADEPAESLKALAVVARSFALVNPRRHGLEGLCDSTHCQAMRMERAPARIEEAVRATAGETLWFGGKRVEGYFSQHCGGVTADAAEVWGGARKSWLVSHGDPYCQRVPSQWRASVEERQLREALAAEGWQVPSPMTSFRVAGKDSSGRATRVALGSGGKPLVVSAASLRFAVNRAVGWNTLRSDWYVAQLTGQPGAARVVFDGKGFGHGVGLCQAGAAEMARQGKSYREILREYFAGVAVRINAGDDGWRQVEGRGWSLRLVGGELLTQRTQRFGAKVAKEDVGEAEVIAAGDAAWEEARKRWAGGVAVRPLVKIAPSTELFRQMTGQPGWALASTAGNDVVLQPLSVVRAHRANGFLEDLLLHEFLHALVEAEASERAPLWLREGMVEMLAGERGEAGAMLSEQIDQALWHAGSLREAQAAHRAACALVRRLVAERGGGTVRGWLRSGVPGSIGAGK